MFLSKLKYAVFFGVLVANIYSSASEANYFLGKWVCESFSVATTDVKYLQFLESEYKKYATGQSWIRKHNIAFLEKRVSSSLMPGTSEGTCTECCDVFLKEEEATKLRSFIHEIKKTDRIECIKIVKNFLDEYKKFLTSISKFDSTKVSSAIKALEEGKEKLNDEGKIKVSTEFEFITAPLLKTWFSTLDNISFDNSKALHDLSHAETFCSYLLLNNEEPMSKILMYSHYDMCHVCEPLLTFVAMQKGCPIIMGSSLEYEDSPNRDSEKPSSLTKVPLDSRDITGYQFTKRGEALTYVKEVFK